MVVVEDLSPRRWGRDRSDAVGPKASTARGMRSQARRGPSIRARKTKPVNGRHCHAGFRSKYPPSGHASPLPIAESRNGNISLTIKVQRPQPRDANPCRIAFTKQRRKKIASNSCANRSEGKDTRQLYWRTHLRRARSSFSRLVRGQPGSEFKIARCPASATIKDSKIQTASVIGPKCNTVRFGQIVAQSVESSRD